MTCLRGPTLLTCTLAVALLPLGCVGVDEGDGPDAGDPTVDAFLQVDALGPGPDADSVDACWCGIEDTRGGADAPPPTPDTGRAEDAGPIVGDSFVANSCGPADGAALQLTISDFLDLASCGADPEHPSTMFYIHDLGGAVLPPTAGATITSSPAASNGTATQCPGGRPPCRLTETWSVTFSTYAADGGASGQYTITWEGGETSTGTFQATRCEDGPVICG